MQTVKNSMKTTNHKPKSMILSLIISLILIGLGVVYAGNTKKGFIIFIAGIVSSLIFPPLGTVIWIYGLIATYLEVKSTNDNKKKTGSKQTDMLLVLVISFLLPGIGVAFAGNTKKGIIIFIVWLITTLIFAPLGTIIWLYGLYATYIEVTSSYGDEYFDIVKKWKNLSKIKKRIIIVSAFLLLVFILFSGALNVFSSLGSPYGDYSTGGYDYYGYDDYGGYSSYSGSSYDSSYDGVDTSPYTLLHDDPDWFYEDYDFGDFDDIDMYLESNGFE